MADSEKKGGLSGRFRSVFLDFSFLLSTHKNYGLKKYLSNHLTQLFLNTFVCTKIINYKI